MATSPPSSGSRRHAPDHFFLQHEMHVLDGLAVLQQVSADATGELDHGCAEVLAIARIGGVDE